MSTDTKDTTFRTAPPQLGPQRPFHFPHVERFTLANGLRVLVAEKSTAPLVSMHLTLRSGADYDPAGKSGLACMTADLLDEGAGELDAIGIAEEIGALGASLWAGSDWDSSSVAFEVLSRNVDRAAEILADVVLRPRFDQEELERVRVERLTTILQQKDEPSSIASDRFAQFVYSGTPYGNPVMGTEVSVGSISREDIVTFYRQHYTPENASLIVAGDIPVAKARELAGRYFGAWEKSAGAAPVTVTPKELETSRIYVVDRPHAVQSEIRVGHVGVPRNTSDYFALVVMNSILGGIFTSRLNMNLRERHGFTYHVRSGFAFRRHPGPFVVGTAVRNEVTAESVREIMSELAAMRSGRVTDAELGDAKAYLTGVFPATVQSANDIAGRLQEMELYGLAQTFFDEYRERIDAVTADDIQRVANRYLAPDKAAIVIVGKADDIQPSLSQLGTPVELFDVEGRKVVRA